MLPNILLALVHFLEIVVALTTTMLSLAAYTAGLPYGWSSSIIGGLVMLLVPIELYLEYVEAVRAARAQWIAITTNSLLFVICIVVIGATMPVLDAEGPFSDKRQMIKGYWIGLLILCVLEAALLLIDVFARVYTIWIDKERLKNASRNTTQTTRAHSLNGGRATLDLEAPTRPFRDMPLDTLPRPPRQPYTRLRDYSPAIPSRLRNVYFPEGHPEHQPSPDRKTQSSMQSDSSSGSRRVHFPSGPFLRQGSPDTQPESTSPNLHIPSGLFQRQVSLGTQAQSSTQPQSSAPRAHCADPTFQRSPTLLNIPAESSTQAESTSRRVHFAEPPFQRSASLGNQAQSSSQAEGTSLNVQNATLPLRRSSTMNQIARPTSENPVTPSTSYAGEERDRNDDDMEGMELQNMGHLNGVGEPMVQNAQDQEDNDERES